MPDTAPIHILPEPYSSWNIHPHWSDDSCRYQRGVISSDGVWVPLLSEKGYDVFNCFKRYVLLSGCRKSAKSIVTANKFLRNMWENDGSIGALIAKTAKNAKGGAWSDMVRFVLEGWQKAGIGIKILEGPKADPVTKMEFIVINNVHGGRSEIQIHSLMHEHEVEEKFKSMRFSCIWLSEADQFKSRHVFDVLKEQLRVIGIPFNNHQFLFDCNPPEEGDEHWLHDLFYKGGEPESPFYIKNHQQFYQRFQFGLDDNPFLNPQEREELENSYGHDKTLRARFIEGKWVKDTTAGLFAEQFIHNIHVVGNASSPDKKDWEIITPNPDAPYLITGTDIGELNHATSFIMQRLNADDDTCYDVFDEVCSIDKQVSVAEFADMVYERVQFWSKWMQEKYKLSKPPLWKHWADSSLFNYKSSSNTNDAQIFWAQSDGTMRLRPVVKGSGSIKQRIALARRLFYSNRLFISAHCKWNIGWAMHLKPGKTKSEPVRAGSEHRHTFDATTYAIGSEIPHEMFAQQTSTTATGIVII